MSKFVENRIEAAAKIIERITSMKQGCRAEDYISARAELNLEIIQAVIGGKIISKDSKKKGVITKIKYTEKPATKKELAIIINMLSDFECKVENPIIIAFNQKIEQLNDEENMDIIPTIAMIEEADISNLDKVNTKKFNKMIFGTDTSTGILASSRISSSNIMELAAYAEDLRKKQNRNKLLIAGGIVLASVGVGVTTKVIIDKKKRKADDILDIDDVSDVDINIDDPIEVPADVDLDAPVVSLNV